MRKRSGLSRVSLVLALIAALLGGFALSAGAETSIAAPVKPRPSYGLKGVGAASVSGTATNDLKAWAAARLANDVKRRSRTLAITPAPVTKAATTQALAAPAPPAPPPSSSTTPPAPTATWASSTPWRSPTWLSHFGTVTSKPVSAYTKGMVEQYTATVYIGSTYYGGTVPDAIPAAFYQDVQASSRPVTWIGDNIWSMANTVGIPAFEQKYGWDPTNSYYEVGGSVGNINQVTYKSQQLTRKIPTGYDGGVLHPAILTGAGYPPRSPSSPRPRTPTTAPPAPGRSAPGT
ncbi:hypothetical protein GCM10020000_60770 [Streptomyces olivoverticillatus]